MSTRTPLTSLLLAVCDAEVQLARHEARTHGAHGDEPDVIHATRYIDGLMQLAADIIVWLEIRGRSNDADTVDDAIAGLVEMARNFDRRELVTEFSDDDRGGPYEPFDQLLAAFSAAAGPIEDLDDALPADVWEGYDDA